MSQLVPVSEARASLSALIKKATEQDITLMNHGRPAAVLISAERYDALLEEIEDLKDRLSVHERDGVTVSLDHLVAELGIAEDIEQKSISEILGIDEGEATDLISIVADQKTRKVRVEYLGPTGVRVSEYEPNEARRVAEELLQWADRNERRK